jgi:hypothetical protein
MPKAARTGSVSLPLREPLPPRLRSTLAKASFRGRDSDSGTNVTYMETIVKVIVTSLSRSQQLLPGRASQYDYRWL